MKSLCGQCNYPMSIKDSMFATGITPRKCPACATQNYRPHPLSSLLVTIGIGLSLLLIATAILVTQNVAFSKISVVFGLSVAVYTAECMLIPLKPVNIEKKKNAEHREWLWVAIFFGTLFILGVVSRMTE